MKGIMNFSGRKMNQSLNRAFIEAMRLMNEYKSKIDISLVNKEVSNVETKAKARIAEENNY
jgi:hypothetical protein